MSGLMKSAVPLVLLCAGTGCAAYKRAAWTPDSVNYTISREHGSRTLTDYIGLNWNLKP